VGLIIHIDGGARGNPGPAGAGVVIATQDGQRIHEAGYFLGTQTNNAAEYHALIRALQRAQRCGDQPLVIRSDSELLVRQITGQYRVRSQTLARLHEQVQWLLLRVGVWSIQHIPREENRRADELANLAVERQQDVIVFDADKDAPATAAGSAVAAPQPSEAADEAAPADERTVQVVVVEAPRANECPAGGLPFESFRVSTTLPEGLCVHAAHALLPTILAVQSTSPADFDRTPTLTVRCTRRRCRATFHVAPCRSSNGSPRKKK